jgi:signal peptidase II
LLTDARRRLAAAKRGGAGGREHAPAGQVDGFRAWSWALVCAAVVMAIDQATKQAAIAIVDPGHPREIIFGVELANVRNRGVAFGLLGSGGDLVVVVTVATIALLLVYFALNTGRPWLWLVTGLVVGGALGNLADRVRIGSAIDFIDPPLWPAFNLADVAIVGGVAWLAMMLLNPDRTPDGRA